MASDTWAASLTGVRLLGEIQLHDFTGDGVLDWLVGRAQCFNKPEGQPEVRSKCVAMIDGRRWVPRVRKNVPGFGEVPPGIAGSWVVIDMGVAMLSAFDATQPQVYWEFRLDGRHSRPMIQVGDRLLLVVGENHLYLVSPKERTPVWDQLLFSQITLPPLVCGGHIAVATQGEMRVLRATDGTVAWKLPEKVHSLRCGADGTQLLVSYQRDNKPHSIAALATATGASTWSRRRALYLHAPLYSDAELLYAFGRDRIIAHRIGNGSMAWKSRAPQGPLPLLSTNDLLIVVYSPPSAAQRVMAFGRKTGKNRWTFSDPSRLYERTAHLTSGGLVLWSRERSTTTGPEGHVVGIDLTTGKQRWVFETPEKLKALVRFGDDKLLVHGGRTFSEVDARTGTRLRRRDSTVVLSRGKALSDRLRYLVYILPPLVILAGIIAWLRWRLSRRR